MHLISMFFISARKHYTNARDQNISLFSTTERNRELIKPSVREPSLNGTLTNAGKCRYQLDLCSGEIKQDRSNWGNQSFSKKSDVCLTFSL